MPCQKSHEYHEPNQTGGKKRLGSFDCEHLNDMVPAGACKHARG